MIPSKIALWGIGLFGIGAGSFGTSEIVKLANRPQSTFYLTSGDEICGITGKKVSCKKTKEGRRLVNADRQAKRGKGKGRKEGTQTTGTETVSA